jgi:pyrimidine operon attenuation protein / uracil phosphoribosyltransferase
MKKTRILDSIAIWQKTRRIAYQVVESNYNEEQLILIGIKLNGYYFAQMLQTEIARITQMPTSLHALDINKLLPLDRAISITPPLGNLAGKTIVMIDDVANTGRTLYYALRPIMDCLPKKVQLAVLVDRQHKLFPISPDYVGLSLSTTMQEHITVDIVAAGEAEAYLD